MKSRRSPVLSMVVGLAVAVLVLGIAAGPAQAQLCGTVDDDPAQTTNNCTILLLSGPNAGSLSEGVPCLGTGQSELIVGTTANDVIDGRGNTDFLFGAAGNDNLCGGGGGDFAEGGAGSDRMFGQGGDDILLDTGGGNDRADGGGGNGDFCLKVGSGSFNRVRCEIF